MEEWLHDLDVYAWRYQRNPEEYSGYHLTATPQACVYLLRIVDMLVQAGPGCKRTVPLKAVTSEILRKAADGEVKCEGFAKMHLWFVDASTQIRQMRLAHCGPILDCHFTWRYLRQFRDAVEDMREGIGDFDIAANPADGCGEMDTMSESLWFWTCV